MGITVELKEIKSKYVDGAMGKVEFIDQMFSKHEVLYEYPPILKNTDIKSIEINEDGVVYTTRKHKIKFISTIPDKRIAPTEIINFNQYEDLETKYFLSFIKPGDVFFDIGANIGWFSLLAGKYNNTGQIFAFEPIPAVYNIFTNNVKLNKFTNVQTFNMGLSDTDVVTQFFFDKNFSGKTSGKNLTDSTTVEKVDVRLERLDKFTSEHNIDKIDILKCDVEGGEYSVYKGGENSLRKFKPIIITELLRKWSAKFNYHPDEVVNFLDQIGYACFSIAKDGLKEIFSIDENVVETNFIFLHREKHGDIIKKERI